MVNGKRHFTPLGIKHQRFEPVGRSSNRRALVSCSAVLADGHLRLDWTIETERAHMLGKNRSSSGGCPSDGDVTSLVRFSGMCR
jgi:hypothetical protein